MTVEPFGADGRRMTWRMTIEGKVIVMVVETLMSGAEVPAMVDGKPSGGDDGRHAGGRPALYGQCEDERKAVRHLEGRIVRRREDDHGGE